MNLSVSKEASILAEALKTLNETFDHENAYRRLRGWRTMSGDGQNESGRKVVLVEVRFSSLLFT